MSQKDLPDFIMEKIHEFPQYKNVQKSDVRWDCLMGC
jgi:hypothetical protein